VSALDFIVEQDIRNALARVEAAHTGPADHHWYEPRWDERLQKFANLIQSGETSLARVIAWVAAGPDRDALGAGNDFIWMGERVSANPLLMGIQRRALFNSVLHARCGAETESVVELGAGDGMNLFAFWIAAAPRQARYMALEITSIGRLCTELLGKLEPDMRVSAHPFDYYAPTYDEIPDGQRHMLVFTSGSIEQIGELPREVIAGLLDKAESVSGVHFEPVGWQLSDVLDPLAESHRQRCLGLGYNQNLWALLNELQKDGRISIDRTIINIFGKLKHPSTLIEWHKEGRSRRSGRARLAWSRLRAGRLLR
jgi:hypothetical protein